MAKTKALISFAVTAKLICVFVFAYVKSRFSHEEAQLVSSSHKRSELGHVIIVTCLLRRIDKIIIWKAKLNKLAI